MSALHLAAWEDSLVDRCGHPWDSGYVEDYWLAILGPSASWLWRRLARSVTEGPTTVDPDVLAASLGIGGKRVVLDRTIHRLTVFHTARWNDGVLEVRRCLPNLTSRQVAQLPEPLRACHAQAISNTVKVVCSS